MCTVIRGLDITVPWTFFPVPALYDEDDAGECHEMLGRGPWFQRIVLEREDIVEKYVCDSWLPGDIRLEWTDKWC